MEEADATSTVIDTVCAIFTGVGACGGDASVSMDAQCAVIDSAPVVYRLAPEEAATQAQLAEALEVLERRLDVPGVCSLETEIGEDGTLALHIVSPAGDSPIDGTVLAPGKLDFYVVDMTLNPGEIAPGFAVLPDTIGAPVTVKLEPLLPPDPIESAQAEFTDWGSWVVHVRLTDEGGEAFGEATGTHIGEAIAIVVDDVVLMKPFVMEAITGGALQIDGNFSAEEAVRLAATLHGGALPEGMRLELLSIDVADVR